MALNKIAWAAVAAIALGVVVMAVSSLWWLADYGEAASANRGHSPAFYVQGYAFLSGAVLFVVGGLAGCLLACWWGARLILGRGRGA